jgi:uncharacterized membrane protein
MHHGSHVAHGLWSLGWLLPVLLLLAIGAVVAILWALTRREQTEGLSRSRQREVEENLEGQVMAMLHQAGGAMTQTEIRANLDLPVDRVASRLRELEEKGRIHRHWEADRYTFTVRAPT